LNKKKSVLKKTAIEIDEYDYPLFCFKYLNETSFSKHDYEAAFFIKYLKRLRDLSKLGWDEIKKSHRHSYGMEKIPVHAIKLQMPDCVSDEVSHLDVFRASGDNRVFIGLRRMKIFHVFFIEANFGDVYDH
jgi:hypothetical protein